MINKIFGKFGFKKIKCDSIKKIEAERDKWFKAYDRAALERNAAWEAFENTKKQIRELEKEIDNLREREAEFKSRLADELQKRLELVEILAESEIVIKAGEGETKTLWHDAKENPPKNSRDVLIWSETGADVGYYGDTMGWIRKDGVIIDVKFWSEFSEPVVPKTVAKEADNMVAD